MSDTIFDESVITATIEDYLEAILVLSEEKGYAQVSEIARMLDISKASVTEMISKLNSYGLVHSKKYSSITLTEKGREIGEKIKQRHDLLHSFLLMLGISPENAGKDACVMEHDLSKDTVNKLGSFILFLEEEEQRDIFERFKKFGKKKLE